MTKTKKTGIWTAGIIGVGTIWALVWPYIRDAICSLLCQ